MSELYKKSLNELHNLLVKKKISAKELTQDALKRIREVEPKVEAFLTIDKNNALKCAKKLDEEGIRKEETLKALPIGLKDNIITKDLLTTAGSKILYNFKPIYNATVVEKLNQAGLVILGKLNMDEFAMGSSGEYSAFKISKNAWDQTKVAGGSSSGSATAVATGEIPVSLGSDTGGSIRQPAAFNGIVGMKPTYGRVSRFGLIAFASSLDQIGPLTRDVKDNALVLNAICGHDVKDATSAKREVFDFTAHLNKGIKGMKIALPEEYLDEGIQKGVKDQILKAVNTFKELGANVEEVSLPHSKYGVAVYYIIASSEASSNLQRFDGIRYGYRTKEFKTLEDVYVKSRSEGFGEEVKRRIMLGTFSLSSGFYDAYFKKAGEVRTMICRDFKKVFENYDVIIGPTTPTVAYKIGENIKDPITMYIGDLLTISVNLVGLPGMSVPAGFFDGLPVGLQIIGNYWEEAKMYQVAAAFEAATNFAANKPAIFEGGKS
ncbi:MAG: Asp-tRNA(Asn)/Glu-tRNA(Gln) amidotransferase subunit GatA [Streptococcaceae bacterium]|jgi:aspartyl-tRNA(Asn)/glutamyl-tRNA(Gln) amidotransferase subunit A|nr:Asp-tRNA(Asn)/Glu-tRNA(Gln) amidotransferase subunit GatA [Streptococcaceae bacterium]